MDKTLLLHITPPAVHRIAALMAAERAVALRVTVQGGGCSGFQYEFGFAKSREVDDLHIEQDSASVLLDPTSAEILAGSTLHFVEELGGSYFEIKNPQAKSSCGCGNSFSLS